MKRKILKKSLRNLYKELKETSKNNISSYKFRDAEMKSSTKYRKPKEILEAIEIIENKLKT